MISRNYGIAFEREQDSDLRPFNHGIINPYQPINLINTINIINRGVTNVIYYLYAITHSFL